MSDPITLLATVKSTRTNSDTGERTITLSVPKSDAGKVAQLSIFDQIVFAVQFTPEEIENKARL